MKFRVFFELYGKKMQTVVESENEQCAEYEVRSAIIFRKIYRIKEDTALDELKKMFGID
jgi:hypothetical protein